MNAIFKADIQDILANPISWEKLRNKVVMITGASGMVGSYLVHTLLALNEQDYNVKVVGVMRNPKKMDEAVLNNPNFEVYVHDVSLPFNYEGTVDYIIHAASPASPLIMKDKPVETAAANALGTYYSLLLAKEKGKFPGFDETLWAQGELPILKANKNALALTKYQPDISKWKQLAQEIKKYGIRNAQLMAIAPTATRI